MQRTDIQARESTRVQAAPVDLEHGRFEPRQVVYLFGIALGGLAFGAFGGLLLNWGQEGSYSRWSWLSSLAAWVGIFGGLLLALGWALAGSVTYLAARGWWRHQQRVDDWHYAQLAAYQAAGGQEREREVRIGSLTLSEPLHVLAVALHVVERAQAGQAAPWSGPALRGDIWYGGLKFGALGKSDAEQFSKALAQLGLVRGRARGAAGQLVSRDVGEVLQLVARNYGRVRPGAPELPDEE